MDFIYSYRKKQPLGFTVNYVQDIYKHKPESGFLIIERLDHIDYLEYHENDDILLMGDVIQFGFEDRLADKGFFYRIFHDQHQSCIEFHSDYHSFLPLYYIENEEEIIISSSVDYLFRLLEHPEPNPLFLAQMVLFNVPLGDTCFFNGVKRLEYGQYISIDLNGLDIVQEKRFYDFYAKHPVPYRKSLSTVVKSFIDETGKYYKEPCYITLTGGFDGRTATALARFYNSDFITYSHGKEDNDDVYIPKMLSQKFGFTHEVVDLGDEYVSNKHNHFVKEHLRHSGGMNGFLYPHASYSAASRVDKSRPIITGYVGSELLRNAHFAGAITSQAALALVACEEIDLEEAFLGSKEALLLSSELSIESLRLVVDRLKMYLRSLPKHLSENQSLACFEFEEVIPKLFGTWVYSSLHYAKFRAPFIDNAFFHMIVTTEVSQFYRKFLEKNPIKRFWGQYLYSKIMEKTWPEIGREMSGKGYAPADLLSLIGRIRVTKGYFRKERLKRSVTFDNLSLISGLKKHLIERSENKTDVGEIDTILEDLHHNERLRDVLLLKYSYRLYKCMFGSRL